MAVTASEARKKLFTLIEQVNNDRRPIEINSKHGDAVLMSRADYRALEETASLLRSRRTPGVCWKASNRLDERREATE